MTVILHASTEREAEWGGPKRYVRIIVHDTAAQFRIAASRYNGDRQSFEGIAACYHTVPVREKYDEKKQDWVNVNDKHWGGVIRLHREELNAEIVVHECMHAAMGIYRMDVRPNANFWRQCNQSEEWISYLMGDLTASVAGELGLAGLL